MKRTMILVGDVNLRHVADPRRPFELVAPTFHDADLVFGNLEGCLYDSDEQVPYKRGWYHAGTSGAEAIRLGGFHAVGCANNVNYGADAIIATLARLDEMGIAHTGAGIDKASAREPVLIERDGVRFGFLQYTSVFWPIGHEASDGSPGVAAMKAHTAYQPNPRIAEMPGGPPTVVTWPDTEYLREFKQDIDTLRDRVDVLVVSCHWGISGSDEAAQYQTALGHAAIDAGADLVMGHGPHVIQAVEVHNGKPIFHSLGNFHFGSEVVPPPWVGLMVRVELEDKEIVRVSCSPVRPNDYGQTTIRSVDQEREAMEKLELMSRHFGTALDLSGNDGVVVRTG